MPTRTNKRTGEVQELQNGQWVTITPPRAGTPALSVQTKPADPLLPAKRTQATNEAVASESAPAQAQADVGKTQAQTDLIRQQMRMGNIPQGWRLKPDGGIERIPGYNPSEQLTPELRSTLISQKGALGLLNKRIDEIQTRFDTDFKGFRRREIIESTPLKYITPDSMRGKAAAFDTAGDTLMGDLKAAMGMTGGEANSPQEVALRFGPWIPKASDSDEVIQAKIARLRQLLATETNSVSLRLGVPKDEQDQNGVTFTKDGRPDYSNIGGGDSVGAADPNATSTNEPFPQASGFLDSLIRNKVPYGKALRAFRQQFPGAEPFSPGDYNRAVQFARRNPDYKGSLGDVTKTAPLSALEQGRNKFAQSGPGAFAGHFANMVAGGLPTYAAGDEGQYFNALSRQQHPYASFAGDIGGGVVGSLGASRLLKPFFPAGISPGGATFLERVASNPATRHAIGDMGYGATVGATQNPGNEGAGAALGAVSSLAGNVIGQKVAAPLFRGVGDAANSLSGGNLLPQRLSGGINLLAKRAQAADNVLGQLDQAAFLNVPLAMADTDPALRALAGSATRKSPDVLRIAERNLEPRQLGQAERAIGAINTHLAPVDDLGNITGAATRRAQDASSDAYGRAMNASPPDDPQLNSMLSTPAGERAAREAYAIALNRGENPAELSFHTLNDGAVRIEARPNWRTLQYMKFGLDKVVKDNSNPITGKLDLSDPLAKSVNDLRANFTKRLGELNPDFAEGNAQYAKFAQQGSAAERGYNATGPKVMPTQVQVALGNLGDGQLPFYRQGAASSLADTVDRTRLASNPFKTIFGSPAQQQKIGAIFPDGAENFGRINNFENEMGKTHTEALRGSQTQPRAEADKLFESGNLGNAAELGLSAMTGTPPVNTMARVLGPSLRDRLAMGVSQRKANQIGPILLNTDPAEAAATLRQILDMAAARKAYADQTRAIGGSLLAPLPLMLGNQ